MHGITSHKTLSNSIPLFVYRSCTRDICKISTFSNFQMFGWIKSKLFTCLTHRFSFYYIKQIDKILPLSVQLYRFFIELKDQVQRITS
jgi:hypothetical protein